MLSLSWSLIKTLCFMLDDFFEHQRPLLSFGMYGGLAGCVLGCGLCRPNGVLGRELVGLMDVGPIIVTFTLMGVVGSISACLAWHTWRD